LALVEGTINSFPFQAVLQPDGKGSHWYKIDKTLSKATKAVAGAPVDVIMGPSKNWPEPALPEDFRNVLKSNSIAENTWNNTTPLSRWDWIRWIHATSNVETRERRIVAACDKLMKGEKRPCCFNRNLCTEPYVSKKGVLLEPVYANYINLVRSSKLI
jgi:hypothetical protein